MFLFLYFRTYASFSVSEFTAHSKYPNNARC